MAVLIDTSFLVALAVPTDRNYRLAQAAYPLLNTTMVLPIPVLPELFYMVMTRVDYAAAVRSYNFLNNAGFQAEALTPQDRNRMSEIMAKYMDTEFDFVDMAIMTLSERLNITRVCTFDRRDFSIYRPAHCDYLELLP